MTLHLEFGPPFEGHPDAELLGVCSTLTAQQAEWQRLWSETSAGGAPETEADLAWMDYSENVWPGTKLTTWPSRRHHPSDHVAKLLALRGTTLEGHRAKAAAILATEDAGQYLGDWRNDTYDLAWSVLEDVAGDLRLPVGQAAAA